MAEHIIITGAQKVDPSFLECVIMKVLCFCGSVLDKAGLACPGGFLRRLGELWSVFTHAILPSVTCSASK